MLFGINDGHTKVAEIGATKRQDRTLGEERCVVVDRYLWILGISYDVENMGNITD